MHNKNAILNQIGVEFEATIRVSGDFDDLDQSTTLKNQTSNNAKLESFEDYDYKESQNYSNFFKKLAEFIKKIIEWISCGCIKFNKNNEKNQEKVDTPKGNIINKLNQLHQYLLSRESSLSNSIIIKNKDKFSNNFPFESIKNMYDNLGNLGQAYNNNCHHINNKNVRKKLKTVIKKVIIEEIENKHPQFSLKNDMPKFDKFLGENIKKNDKIEAKNNNPTAQINQRVDQSLGGNHERNITRQYEDVETNLTDIFTPQELIEGALAEIYYAGGNYLFE